MGKNPIMAVPASSPGAGKDASFPDIPAAALAAIRSILSDAEELQTVVPSDIGFSGKFGEAYFIVTNERIISVELAEKAITGELCIPVGGIVSIGRRDFHGFSRRDFHGFSRLEAVTAETSVTIAHFTRNRADSFQKAVERFTGMSDKQRQAPHKPGGKWGGFGQALKVCETCGKPIPHWVGVCPDCIDKGKIFARLIHKVKPYFWYMGAGLVLMFLITGLDMAQPILTKILVDTIIPTHNLQMLVLIIFSIFGIHLFTSVFSGIRSYFMAWLGEKITHDLRCDMYNHLQLLSLDFYDQHETGWIMDRISADTSNLQDFLTEGFQDFIRDSMSILVIISIMAAMNWRLTLITLLPAPFVAFFIIRFMRKIRRQFHRVWRKRSRMTSLLSDVIPGVRVVKAFAQEKREIVRFTGRSLDYMESSVDNAKSFSMFHPVTEFATSLGTVMIWGMGGYQVITGQGVTLGTLIAFISYLWRFYGPLNNLSRLSRRLERAFTSAQRVFDVLDTAPGVQDTAGAENMPEIKGKVAFKNVSFGYDPSEIVLDDISFTVQPGEMIGLVGQSGAGKSTTINLLCRFYEVLKGSIEIDGRDIRSLPLAGLHRQIGVVLQEPFLFHGTIAENISYGNPDANLKSIIRAAKAANAHGFIMRLPEGYDTMVGERGQRLSGGERQRIAIARAILKDPKILILDEATSSVDTETEASIQQAVERLIQGRTTFAIAHRFSTLRNADRLIVLDQGKIAEIGTHEELLAKDDGLFRRLCDIQTQNNQIIAVGG
ncbi:MAG: ABC transporter ATP-binding protein [Bacillota bacterium]